MIVAARTTSQIVLHMSVAFGITFAFTGSLAMGGAAAVLEPICNVILMPLHDRMWDRIRARWEGGDKGAGTKDMGATPAAATRVHMH